MFAKFSLKTLYLIILLAFFLMSCGYQFQGSGSILPPDVKTVAIPLVQNDTTDSTLTLTLTEALRSRFDRYGVVTVVERADDADAVLSTRIVKVSTDVQGVTSATDIELESSVTMDISAELKRQSGQVLWRNPNLRVTKSYASVSDTVVTSSSSFAQSGISSGSLSTLGSREVSRGQQQEALEELIDDVAQTIYFRAVASDF
jgi:outer membrane lipopolysaccharide assembly protein LptE/RlpB